MQALTGLRLLDLTHMLAGPYASLMLADMGMEVLKIEPPGAGEGTRVLLGDHPTYNLDGMGAYFLSLNRNKKSLTLNLKSEQGREIFYRLVEEADVVLDNFSVGVTTRLGIDYDRLSAINPRIITCSITGFGATGPDKDWVAFDLVTQAMGGAMSFTGHPGNPPTRSGIPTGDVGGGLMAVIGTLAALVARQTTGRGQHVDISMLDAQISMLTYAVTMYYLSGQVPKQQGNGHFLHVPYNTYPCSDGWIVVAVIVDHFWKTLVDLLGLPELDTPENETALGRTHNEDLINERLAEVFQTDTVDHWLDVLTAARIPCAPVNTLDAALDNPQVAHRHMVVDVDAPGAHHFRAAGNPIKLSDTGQDRFCPPPTVGQHTDEILRGWLGLDEEVIQQLKDDGVI